MPRFSSYSRTPNGRGAREARNCRCRPGAGRERGKAVSSEFQSKSKSKSKGKSKSQAPDHVGAAQSSTAASRGADAGISRHRMESKRLVVLSNGRRRI